jgi:AraC-like DNA-binding protein
MSGINRYYEDLVFDSGAKINVSRQINNDYFDTVHWHPYVELLVSRCDGNRATVNFNSYQLNQNDIALIWSGDLHAVQSVRDDSYLIIQFPIALLAVMGELNGILPRLSRLHCVRYDEKKPETLQIIRCAEAIEQHHFQDGPFREVQVYADLLNLFALIGKQCIQVESDVPEAENTTDRTNLKLMTEACLYISENCMKPLSLNDVALEVGVSRSHFAHLFKNYTNMTFVDFLTVERVKLAETFFMNPNLRITDIAFESGFSSISSFNRSFRKIKGCSPTEFRATMID